MFLFLQTAFVLAKAAVVCQLWQFSVWDASAEVIAPRYCVNNSSFWLLIVICASLHLGVLVISLVFSALIS